MTADFATQFDEWFSRFVFCARKPRDHDLRPMLESFAAKPTQNSGAVLDPAGCALRVTQTRR